MHLIKVGDQFINLDNMTDARYSVVEEPFLIIYFGSEESAVEIYGPSAEAVRDYLAEHSHRSLTVEK